MLSIRNVNYEGMSFFHDNNSKGVQTKMTKLNSLQFFVNFKPGIEQESNGDKLYEFYVIPHVLLCTLHEREQYNIFLMRSIRNFNYPKISFFHDNISKQV